MSKHNLMMTTLFFISLSFAFFSTSPDLSAPNFVLAIVLFVFFSILYSQVRVKINYGETELNYAINLNKLYLLVEIMIMLFLEY